MKEYPVIFSPPMVRALLEDHKTVTRRLSKQWLKVKAGDRTHRIRRRRCWSETMNDIFAYGYTTAEEISFLRNLQVRNPEAFAKYAALISAGMREYPTGVDAAKVLAVVRKMDGQSWGDSR